MAGTSGTARFGNYADATPDKTNAQGVSHLTLPKDGNQWTETHYLYSPNQLSREMGSTEGAAPGPVWSPVEHQPNYMCNHDGFLGGNNVVTNLDERKVLSNTVYSVNCEYDDGCAPSGTTGKFD